MTGYLNRSYAESLAEFGVPDELPESKGWILRRPIPGVSWSDAMGCYPLFVCQDWTQLKADLEQLGSEVVCLSLVTDPFGDYDETYLRQCFPDLVVPFKRHFVVDLNRAPEEFVHTHHIRNARKALREIHVERCDNPSHLLDDWMDLYRTLVERHGITGIAAFSRESFAKQLAVTGLTAIRAIYKERTIGMVLWYEHNGRAYYHLGAYSPQGYELRASFALFDYSIRHFAQRGFERLDLGAGSGLGAGCESGLSRFKRGWSTGVRTAYFCGRIFCRDKYHEILRLQKVAETNYFPAYRQGEFG